MIFPYGVSNVFRSLPTEMKPLIYVFFNEAQNGLATFTSDIKFERLLNRFNKGNFKINGWSAGDILLGGHKRFTARGELAV